MRAKSELPKVCRIDLVYLRILKRCSEVVKMELEFGLDDSLLNLME